MDIPSFSTLFDYDTWANRDVVRSLGAGDAVVARPLALMAHIVGAEWLWWARIEGAVPRLAVWPTLSVGQCGAEVDELGRTWSGYLGRITARELERGIAYTNSKGESYTSAVRDILTHVVLHSVYHRGQIATALRAAGREPAYTDYIHARRSGFVVSG
jgi:uncharacterized damage-inducible protein DinB